MATTGGTESTTLVALYAALIGGVVLFAAVSALFLRPAPPAFDPSALRLVWLATAAAGLVGGAWARGRFEKGERSAESAVRSAALVWALAEGPALIGVVGYLLTGDRALLVLALGAFAWGMARHPPAAFRPEAR